MNRKTARENLCRFSRDKLLMLRPFSSSLWRTYLGRIEILKI
jgi:hypothetical protein